MSWVGSTATTCGSITDGPGTAYALFGPSRILVLGPDSALAGVILGVVTPLSGVGLATLIVILLLKNSKRLLGILIAVVGATIVDGALDLGTLFGVKVLGPLPQGLPGFVVP